MRLIPPKGAHLTCFHGVFAPSSKLRAFVVKEAPPSSETSAATASVPRPTRVHTRPRLDWASLQRAAPSRRTSGPVLAAAGAGCWPSSPPAAPPSSCSRVSACCRLLPLASSPSERPRRTRGSGHPSSGRPSCVLTPQDQPSTTAPTPHLTHRQRCPRTLRTCPSQWNAACFSSASLCRVRHGPRRAGPLGGLLSVPRVANGQDRRLQAGRHRLEIRRHDGRSRGRREARPETAGGTPNHRRGRVVLPTAPQFQWVSGSVGRSSWGPLPPAVPMTGRCRRPSCCRPTARRIQCRSGTDP